MDGAKAAVVGVIDAAVNGTDGANVTWLKSMLSLYVNASDALEYDELDDDTDTLVTFDPAGAIQNNAVPLPIIQ